jgi:hypothetical protein
MSAEPDSLEQQAFPVRSSPTPAVDTSAVAADGGVAVARTIAEVEQLRPVWTAQRTSRDGDIDFYLTIVQSWPEVIRPHVITITRNDGQRAMLIGRLETKPLTIRIGYLRLPTPPLRTLTFINGGALSQISAQDTDPIICSILRSLRAGEADVAVLEHFNIAHPLSKRARTLPARLCTDLFPTAQSHHRRTLGGAEPLLASLSSNERNNQRRREKRLRQEFRELRIGCLHDASSLDTLLRDVEAVARSSYQRRLGVGFSDTAQMRERLAFEAEKGTLRGHVLYADGKPCAFWIASLYRGVLSNDFMGFDPAYSKYAPGMYLVLNVLEEVRRDPSVGTDPVVDFGIGDGEWKARLGNEQWQEASIAVFAPTIKGVALNAVRTAAAVADRGARALLRHSRMLPQLKRLWRQQLTR